MTFHPCESYYSANQPLIQQPETWPWEGKLFQARDANLSYLDNLKERFTNYIKNSKWLFIMYKVSILYI